MTNVFSHNCDIHVLYLNSQEAIFNFDDSWNHFTDVIYVPIAFTDLRLRANSKTKSWLRQEHPEYVVAHFQRTF